MNKAPAVPSSYNGSASHCIPLPAKAVFEQNEGVLRTGITVPITEVA